MAKPSFLSFNRYIVPIVFLRRCHKLLNHKVRDWFFLSWTKKIFKLIFLFSLMIRHLNLKRRVFPMHSKDSHSEGKIHRMQGCHILVRTERSCQVPDRAEGTQSNRLKRKSLLA